MMPDTRDTSVSSSSPGMLFLHFFSLTYTNKTSSYACGNHHRNSQQPRLWTTMTIPPRAGATGCAYTLARNKWARDAWFMYFFFNGMCFLVPLYYFTYIYLQLNSYDCTTTETHSNPGYGLRRQYHQGLELWLCSTK
jgi:hypothetical protein